MRQKLLIIGNNIEAESVEKAYRQRGFEVEHRKQQIDIFDANHYEEVFLMADSFIPSSIEADSACLELLDRIAGNYDLEKQDGKPLTCRLLLRSSEMLRLLQAADFSETVRNSLAVFPFTMEDLWAKEILANNKEFRPLDRQPINTDSQQVVHLVIFGTNEMAKSLAVNAALVAHFPNYVRNPLLRTRITIVGSHCDDFCHKFKECYRYLMENSYYRYINLNDKESAPVTHKPLYSRTREDFVDVEWEFVKGDCYDTLLRQKLCMWSSSPYQILTVGICAGSDDENLDLAMNLPEELYQNRIPVLVHQKQSTAVDMARRSEQYNSMVAFGMDGKVIDPAFSLLERAKYLNYFYTYSWKTNQLPTFIPKDEVDAYWKGLTRYTDLLANLNSVMTFAVKMRSLGHDESDYKQFYALNATEIEQMAAVEHNRWSIERLIAGFRPPTDKEREEIRQDLTLKQSYRKRRIHYDLCAYSELDVDDKGNDVRQYDRDLTACIPLIVNSLSDNE